MRIVLDIRHRGTRSGSVSYIHNLVPRLLESDSGHQFVLLRTSGQPLPGGVDCETVELPPQRAVVQAMHEQLVLPRLLRQVGAEIYHPLKYLGSMFPGCAQVTTAHSITVDYRGTFPGGRSEAVYWKMMGPRIMRASTALVAVSAFIRDFLVERIGVLPERITVIPNGIDPRFTRLAVDAPGMTTDDAPYLLAVGNVFPVKNHLTAVRALAGVAAEFPTLRLKIAGATSHAYCGEVRRAAELAGIADRVDFLGFVEVPGLVPLMNRATSLLMPSLTEGCPVTLLEAMACGTPVIASGRGGIPEIAADAAIIVEDPLDTRLWTLTVAELCRSEARRTQLCRAGVERSRQFTWHRTADSTLRVYDSLA
jgi:glycosyltransferase involved in cell wall biosynthesis